MTITELIKELQIFRLKWGNLQVYFPMGNGVYFPIGGCAYQYKFEEFKTPYTYLDIKDDFCVMI